MKETMKKPLRKWSGKYHQNMIKVILLQISYNFVCAHNYLTCSYH